MCSSQPPRQISRERFSVSTPDALLRYISTRSLYILPHLQTAFDNPTRENNCELKDETDYINSGSTTLPFVRSIIE